VPSGGQAQVLALAASWQIRCHADRYGLVTFLVHQKVSSYLSCLSRMAFRLYLRISALCYCYLRSDLLWCITHRIVAIIFRHFGITFQSHVQGPRNPRRKLCSFFIYLHCFFFTLRPRLKENIQRIKQVVDERRVPRPVSYFLVVLKVVTGYRIVPNGYETWEKIRSLTLSFQLNLLSSETVETCPHKESTVRGRL
jgi:hypothetical protein